MTAIATVRALVTAQLPEANDLLVDRTLIEIARDFCDVTRAWKKTTTGLTVTASTHEVAITPPTDGELVDVISAMLDAVPLTKKTQQQLDALAPTWRTIAGTPNYVTLDDETLDQVMVAPLPATTYTSLLNVRAAYKPVLGATTLPAVLVSKYSDTLVAGALGRLYVIPKTPWENSQLAAYYVSLYEMQRDAARQTSTDDRMGGVGRTVAYGGL